MKQNKTDIWMPIYIGDYLADTMHLTNEQHGVYLLIIMAYWKNKGPLPKKMIKKISKTDSKNIAVIKRFFDLKSNPGFWTHERIEKELVAAKRRKDAAVRRGKKGAKIRWGT